MLNVYISLTDRVGILETPSLRLSVDNAQKSMVVMSPSLLGSECHSLAVKVYQHSFRVFRVVVVWGKWVRVSVVCV